MTNNSREQENISDEKLVEEIANLARLNIPRDEISNYAVQMRAILAHFGDLKEIDLEGVSPTVQIHSMEPALAPDMTEPGLSRNAMLGLSNRRDGDVLSVPRIVNPENETAGGD